MCIGTLQNLEFLEYNNTENDRINRLHEGGKDKIDAATRICSTVSNLLICISENSRVYLDIKPENIFVEEEKTHRIYLGDLGSVTEKEKNEDGTVNEKKTVSNAPKSPSFLPPSYFLEVIQYKIDMMQSWALAMTFMDLLDKKLFQTECRPDDTEEMAKELKVYMNDHKDTLDQALFIKNILQSFVDTLKPDSAASKEFKTISVLKLRF